MFSKECLSHAIPVLIPRAIALLKYYIIFGTVLGNFAVRNLKLFLSVNYHNIIEVIFLLCSALLYNTCSGHSQCQRCAGQRQTHSTWSRTTPSHIKVYILYLLSIGQCL